jgi:hypothetical protein
MVIYNWSCYITHRKTGRIVGKPAEIALKTGRIAGKPAESPENLSNGWKTDLKLYTHNGGQIE